MLIADNLWTSRPVNQNFLTIFALINNEPIIITMLKHIRQIMAVVSIVMVTLLFVDFTGIAHRWFGWMAKIQFLPALLALNVGVIIGLIALTLLFGRVYCSVICPLGIMQDGFAWLGK